MWRSQHETKPKQQRYEASVVREKRSPIPPLPARILLVDVFRALDGRNERHRRDGQAKYRRIRPAKFSDIRPTAMTAVKLNPANSGAAILPTDSAHLRSDTWGPAG
jgi:hypothetical protein